MCVLFSHSSLLYLPALKDGDLPYCSPDCQFRAAPSALPTSALGNVQNDDDDDDDNDDHRCSVLEYELKDVDTHCSPSSTASRWLGNDNAGIAAWAADIPPNAPPTVPNVSSPPEQVRSHPVQPLYRSYRAPPNLLNSSRKVAPPCLSTLPTDSSHPSPIVTPSRQSSADQPTPHRKTSTQSKSSSKSAQTESPVSTPSSSNQPSLPIFCPSRKSSILGDMYINVRSWVSPSSALFLPVQLPHQQRQPLPIHKLDSSCKFFMLTTQPPPPKKPLACHNYLARGRHLPGLAFNDDPPSFRPRGRKSSRAAA